MKRATIVCLILLAMGRLLFISDIPFGNDDAKLFLKAMGDQEAGAFTSVGLLGSKGLDYGPFCIWVYRGFLSVTRNVETIALVRTALIALVTLLSLLYFGRVFPTLRSGVLPVAFLSPYLYNYGRDLWDNSLVIPLSAILFVSYLEFCRSGRRAFLGIAFLMGSLGFLTHLVFIPVVLAMVTHLMCTRWKWVKGNLPTVLLESVVAIAVASPYLAHLARTVPRIESGGAPLDLGHFLTPFVGARFYTVMGIEHFIGRQWYAPFQASVWDVLWVAAISVSLLAFAAVWHGMVLAVQIVRSERRDLLYDMSFLALAAMVFQIGMSVAFRLIPIPNFHSALWFVYFFFLWLSISHLWERRWARRVLGMYIVSLLIGNAGVIAMVHHYGGSRHHHYGPTLKNLLHVVREHKRTGGELIVTVEHLQKHLFVLHALSALEGEGAKGTGTLVVRYRSPHDERDAHLIVTPE